MRVHRRICCLIFMLVSFNLFLYWWLGNRRMRRRNLTKDSIAVELQGTKVSHLIETTSQLEIRKQGAFLNVQQGSKGKALAAPSETDKQLKLDDLLKRLNEIENKMLPKTNTVLVTGETRSVENNLPFYQPALEELGYFIRQGQLGNNIDWAALFCFTREEDLNLPCFRRLDVGKLKPYQKVSKIPGLQHSLTSSDAFCYLTTAARDIPALKLEGLPLSTTCFVLPAQFEKFTTYISTRGLSSYWIVRPLGKNEKMETFVYSKDQVELERWKTKNVLVQEFADFVMVSGAAAVVKLYVAVTAMSPLRAYIHGQGVVVFVPFKGGVASTWSLEQFHVHLVSLYGKTKAAAIFSRLKVVIIQTLLITEAHLDLHFKGTIEFKERYRCPNCFQLLTFECAILRKSLIPVVLKVSGEADLQQAVKIRSNASSHSTSVVGRDLVNLLFTRRLVAKKLFDLLKKTKESSKWVEEWFCKTSNNDCVKDVDLEYLVAAKREESSLGGFSKLYPVADGARYTKLLKDPLTFTYIDNLNRGNFGELNRRLKLHKMLAVIEDLNPPQSTNFRNVWEITDSDLEHRKRSGAKSWIKIPATLSSNSNENRKCDPDNQHSEPVLSELNFEPSGNKLEPSFNKEVKNYKMEVAFGTMALQIWARIAFCRFRVSLDTKLTDLTRPLNYSLGIGWNEVVLRIVDTIHSVPRVATRYKVFVYRQSREKKTRKFNNTQSHEACGLNQECSLRMMPTNPCGLYKLQDDSWKAFLRRQTELKICQTGHEQGIWAVPCEKCYRPNSCYWRRAVWAPLMCRHKILTRNQTQRCLANKKVIFLGDSTNRGMMYYLMEKVNGTLTKWQRTHEIRTYDDNLNGGQTSVSFAYYPQFWKPQNMRLTFTDALHQLIARNLPLENSTKTVLVVGGLQWMTIKHLESIRLSLFRLSLNGIKVVVKSYGAGLHFQNNDPMNAQELQLVARRNKILVEEAGKLGYEVIDTFNITVSRYREYFQGRCRCHFHKVVSIGNFSAPEDEEQRNVIPTGRSGTFTKYHVIGPINALYSEILITRLCS